MTAGKSSYNSVQAELRYGTPKHDRIKNMILERKRFSAEKMKDLHTRWNDIDDRFRAYIPESELESEKRLKRDTMGKFDYITLEIPYTYAVVLTAHTYLSSVFFGRNPIYQFTARHGEPQDAIMAVEAIMDYQLQTGGHLPVLFNWLFDMAKYGIGVIGNYWCEESATISNIVEEPVTILGIPVPNKTRKVKQSAVVRGYAGNRLYNVSIYDIFPDPRLPLSRFQDGEFFGRKVSAGMHELIEGEAQGRFFNTDRVGKMRRGTDPDAGEPASHLELPYLNQETPYRGPSFVDLLEMHVRIVPRDWGLGASSTIEKWVFTVANNEVIIGAQPLGLYHNRYPYAIMEYGLGTEEFFKASMSEVMEPMSNALSWLFNSHMYGVRKTLNDVRIADPSRVVLKDMMTPYGGSIIRLKPAAYGTDARTAIQQLPVGDVTQAHLRDMQVVEAMIQRALGVVDNLMGQSEDAGSRKTATEVRASTGFATSRLKTIAEYNSALAFSPLAQMMLMNTQQLYDDEKKFRIAGSLMETAMSFTQQVVTPESIAGFYDFVPVDGTMPIDRFAQAQFWKELVMAMANNPALAMQWDINGIIAHTMSLQGERNINRFRIAITPDQQLAAQAMAGNVAPINKAGGSRVSNAAGGGVKGTGTAGGIV